MSFYPSMIIEIKDVDWTPGSSTASVSLGGGHTRIPTVTVTGVDDSGNSNYNFFIDSVTKGTVVIGCSATNYSGKIHIQAISER